QLLNVESDPTARSAGYPAYAGRDVLFGRVRRWMSQRSATNLPRRHQSFLAAGCAIHRRVASGWSRRGRQAAMPFLSRPGCDLYYEVTGAGPAVVFAHGLGGNHLSWWQQVPHLAERYTCVTFSHRGFGPSREDPGGPGPAAFVGDLSALLDRLGV